MAKEWRPYISKTDLHHILPLSTQALAILEAIQPLTGGGRYMFPSIRGDGRRQFAHRHAIKSGQPIIWMKSGA